MVIQQSQAGTGQGTPKIIGGLGLGGDSRTRARTAGAAKGDGDEILGGVGCTGDFDGRGCSESLIADGDCFRLMPRFGGATGGGKQVRTGAAVGTVSFAA